MGCFDSDWRLGHDGHCVVRAEQSLVLAHVGTAVAMELEVLREMVTNLEDSFVIAPYTDIRNSRRRRARHCGCYGLARQTAQIRPNAHIDVKPRSFLITA